MGIDCCWYDLLSNPANLHKSHLCNYNVKSFSFVDINFRDILNKKFMDIYICWFGRQPLHTGFEMYICLHLNFMVKLTK